MFTKIAAMTAWLTCLAVLTCVYFPADVSGSAIVFQSSASSIKPLISDNLKITCSLHDTSPGGGAVVGRSLTSLPEGNALADDVMTGGGAVVGRSLTSLPEGDALADDVMTGEEEETHTDQQNSDNPDDPDDLDNPDDPDDQPISKKSLTQTTEDIQFVTSIMITHDGKDLATITEHFPAMQVGGASGFQVSGQLPGTSGEKGHLELVFAHPTHADSGNYSCFIDTLNIHGRSYDFSQSLKITEEEVSIKDLVSHIQEMQLEKENSNIKMSKTIEEMNATIGNQANTIGTILKSEEKMNHSLNTQRKTIEEMNASIRVMNATIGNQANTIANQANTIGNHANTIGNQANTIGTILKSEEKMNQSLNALRNIARVEPNVFFSALLTSSGTTKDIPQSQAVVYDKVISNEGGSYSSSTGAFTTPVDGFYHFEVHAYSISGRAYLSLQHNGNRVITVEAHGSNDHRGSSNSATVKLTKGDTVNVVSYSGTSHIFSRSTDYMTTTFSGQLISLL